MDLLYIPSTCYIEIRAPPKDRDGGQSNNSDIAIFNVENGIATYTPPAMGENVKIVKNRK